MDADEALKIIETALLEDHLSKIQVTIFRDTWNERSYQEIARSSGYELGYIKQAGSQLWQLLSKALGEKVRKSSVHSVLRRYANRLEQPGNKGIESTNKTGLNSFGRSQESESVQNPRRKISPTGTLREHNSFLPISPLATVPYQDWGEATDVSIFFGRTEELATLEQWVVRDRCRLVGLFGMGGIGKTALSVKLAKEIVRSGGVDEWMSGRVDGKPSTLSPTGKLHERPIHPLTHPSFQFVIWRSLRNAPPIHSLLADLIQFLSDQQETVLPESLDQQVLQLLKYLRAYRCLLILDNAETVMQAGSSEGSYQTGYEGYGQLLRCVGESEHQSCLLLTSREKPKGFAPKEGETLPVRSLQIAGLAPSIGRELFNAKGQFSGSPSEWQTLIAYYAGNPLALKIVATAIADFFNGNIAHFLEFSQRGGSVFGDIRDLLARQIGRLSVLEQQVIVWLAINREPISFGELQTDCFPSVSPVHLLETLTALERRSLIEKVGSLFTLQPAVMEYMTEQLIEQSCEQIVQWPTEKTGLYVGNPQKQTRQQFQSADLNLQSLSLSPGTQIPNHPLYSYALVKATAKDYIRETQTRLILQPILDRLLSITTPPDLDKQLMSILANLRGKSFQETGYTGGNILNLLSQLQVEFSDRNFSHLVLWQACLRGKTLHRVDFSHSDLAKSIFTETFSQILSVAFSPDGRFLVASDISYEAHVWRVADGKKILTCEANDGWAWATTFSPDCRLLASSANGTILFWDLQTGECVRTLSGYASRIFSLAFSPDGQFLASAYEDHEIRIWHVATGDLVTVLSGHTDEVHSVVFSPDGQFLASGSYDGTVKLWNMAEVRSQEPEFNSKYLPGRAKPYKTQNSSYGDNARRRNQSEGLTKLKPQTSNSSPPLTLQAHTHWVWSVAFSPDGKLLASSSSDRTIKLWDLATGVCTQTLVGHSQPVRSIAFASNQTSLGLQTSGEHSGEISSPPEYLLASGSDDNTLRLWSSKGRCLRVLHGHTSWISAVSFSPDGCLLASGSEDQSVRLWDSHTNQCLNVLQGYNSGVWAIAFSLDGNTLISGGQDRLVRLWDVSGIKEAEEIGMAEEISQPEISLFKAETPCFSTLTGHNSWIWSIALSPDGQAIASGGEEGTILLWDDLNIGHSIDPKIRQQSINHQTSSPTPLNSHTHPVWSVAFSPNGQILASGSLDGTVRLWDRSTGRCCQTLQQHRSGVWSVAFAPQHSLTHLDAQLLASGSQDQTIQLWEIRTSVSDLQANQRSPELAILRLKTLEGHTSWIRCVAFSPDGMMLASGSSDGILKLWNVATGDCLKTFQAHTSLVLAVAFSPDGQTLATGGGDGKVKLWDASSLRVDKKTQKVAKHDSDPIRLLTLQGHQKWVRFLSFRPDGGVLASCSQDGTIKLWNLSGFCLATLRIPRPFEGTNITGISGLTEAQKNTLKLLGAIN